MTQAERPPLARLPLSFYEQPVLRVARACVGKLLVHVSDDGLVAGRIGEAEAYRGPQDLAAHSAGGRRTKRTEVMFGPPGRAYVFLLYGSSWAFNIVAGRVDQPHAVLIRALGPVLGLELMAARRGMSSTRRALCNGPGKLCRALRIDGGHYGADLAAGPLYLAEDPTRRPSKVGRSPRINIDYAGAWVARPYRFFELGNAWVSVRPRD